MEESSGKANSNDIRKVRGSSKSTARRLNLKTAESIVREIIAETQHEENVSEDTVPSSGNKRRRESLLADAFHSGSLENTIQHTEHVTETYDLSTRVNTS